MSHLYVPASRPKQSRVHLDKPRTGLKKGPRKGSASRLETSTEATKKKLIENGKIAQKIVASFQRFATLNFTVVVAVPSLRQQIK